MLSMSYHGFDVAGGAEMLVGEIVTSPAVTVRDNATPQVAMLAARA